MPREPLLIESCVGYARCDGLRRLFWSSTARPRSYQGVVDRAVRDCSFVATTWSAVPELDDVVRDVVAPAFGVSIWRLPTAQLMIYLYTKGPGFAPHHDLVTPLEQHRARTNGQPVVPGDFTLVLFLSDPDEYEGGALYFPDYGLSFRPPAGALAAFPAREEYIHGVAAVGFGERFTAVARCFVGRRW